MVLHFSKVNIVLNLQGIFDRKTTESVVNSDLVLVSQFNGAFRQYAAIVFYGIDRDLKSIYFS